LEISGGLAPRKTGENFARARNHTLPRHWPRGDRNRRRIRRRKAKRPHAIRSERAFAGLLGADPPTGPYARPFLQRSGRWPSGAACRPSQKSLNPLSHGAPPRARRRSRNPVGRPRRRRN
jgi:hypothetical protein